MTSPLALKLAVAPVFVALVTLFGRSRGPAAAGFIASLPVVAGPILVLLVATHGNAFGATAAYASAVGVVPTMCFAFAFAHVAQRFGTLTSLGLSYLVYFAMAGLLWLVPVGVPSALLVPTIAYGVLLRWFPHGGEAGESSARPPSVALDVPMRMLATLALVATVTSLAGWLGPAVAGLVTPFPVITAVLAAFTRSQAGPRATAMLLRALVRGVPSFVTFFVTAGTLLPQVTAPVALASALAACMGSHALLLRLGVGAPAR